MRMGRFVTAVQRVQHRMVLISPWRPPDVSCIPPDAPLCQGFKLFSLSYYGGGLRHPQTRADQRLHPTAGRTLFAKLKNANNPA